MTLLAAAVRLLRPEALLLLLALPLFAWLALRGRRARAGEVAALTARGALLVLVVLALSLPRIESEARFRSVAYVLDVSDSIPRAALDDAKEFVRRSAALHGKEDDASFLVFADGSAVESPMTRLSATQRVEPVPIDPRALATRLPTGESDVESALRLARAGFPPGGARAVVLVTDGNETRGNALAAVKELLAERTEVLVVPLRYRREREVWIDKVVAPAIAAERAPVPVRVLVESTHDGVKSRLRLLVDGSEVRADDVVLRAGRNAFEVGVPFDVSGFHRIEAVVEPEQDGDPVNNRGAAATMVRGRGRVLVASAEPGSPLAETLAKGLDLHVEAGSPARIPADPGDLLPYDCIVLENVAAWALTDVQKRVLRSAVEDLGIGLVVVGGIQVYGPGGYGGTDLEAVLPVTSDVTNRRVLPSGALVVALHSCEFPEGNTIGREVTKLAIRALSPDDEMGLIQFAPSGGDEWVIPLSKIGNRERHLALVDKSDPSDAPSLHSILSEAADALEKSTAAAKHVIVITDGDPVPPDDKLLARLADDLRVTVSTVCIDPHTPDSFRSMRRIAEATGGNPYELESRNRDRIPQIFVKEAVTIRRPAWKEETFDATLRSTHRMVRDFPDGFPKLDGRTITTLRGEAELVLSAPEDDPLLATWRRGLGQATAWTSDASARWGGKWVGWEGYSKFWTQVVRANLRVVERSAARLAIEREGGTAHVVLDALRDDGGFENGLRVRGTALGPDGRPAEFRLAQTGPGRYEGSFAAPQVGTYLATVTWADPKDASGSTLAQAQAAVCVAYSAEHLAQGSNERLFAAMEGAGARVIDLEKLEAEAATDPGKDPAALPWTGPVASTEDPLDLWPWLAGLAALVLVIDVAVRRVRVDWAKILPRRRPAAAAAARPLAAGAAKAPAAGSFDPASAGAVPISKDGGAAPEATPAPAPPPGPAADAGGLLEAKRRAKRKQTWEENP
jgi:uncharacterized membrane protein